MYTVIKSVLALVGAALLLELGIRLKSKYQSSLRKRKRATTSDKARKVLQKMEFLKDTGVNNSKDFHCVLFFPDAGIACLSQFTSGKPCTNTGCGFLHESTSLVALTDILNLAKKHLEVCVYVITCRALEGVLLDCRKRGVLVRVIMDKGQTEQAQGALRLQGSLMESGISVRVSNTVNLMHHKFAVVDKEILINGSFNWTQQAITGNYENLIITSATDLVAPYVAEFEKIWKAFEVVSDI